MRIESGSSSNAFSQNDYSIGKEQEVQAQGAHLDEEGRTLLRREAATLKRTLKDCAPGARAIKKLLQEQSLLEANGKEIEALLGDLLESEVLGRFRYMIPEIKRVCTLLTSSLAGVTAKAGAKSKEPAYSDRSRVELANSIAQSIVAACNDVEMVVNFQGTLTPETLGSIKDLKAALEIYEPTYSDIMEGKLANPKHARQEPVYSSILQEISSELDPLWSRIRRQILLSKSSPDGEACLKVANETVAALYELFAKHHALGLLLEVEPDGQQFLDLPQEGDEEARSIPFAKNRVVSLLQHKVAQYLESRKERIAERNKLAIDPRDVEKLAAQGVCSASSVEEASEKLPEIQSQLEKNVAQLEADMQVLQERIGDFKVEINRLFDFAEKQGHAPYRSLAWLCGGKQVTRALMERYVSDWKEIEQQALAKRKSLPAVTSAEATAAPSSSSSQVNEETTKTIGRSPRAHIHDLEQEREQLKEKISLLDIDLSDFHAVERAAEMEERLLRISVEIMDWKTTEELEAFATRREALEALLSKTEDEAQKQELKLQLEALQVEEWAANQLPLLGLDEAANQEGAVDAVLDAEQQTAAKDLALQLAHADIKLRPGTILEKIQSILDTKAQVEPQLKDAFRESPAGKAYYQIIRTLIEIQETLRSERELITLSKGRAPKARAYPSQLYGVSPVQAKVQTLSETASKLLADVKAKLVSAQKDGANNLEEHERDLQALQERFASLCEGGADGLSIKAMERPVDRRITRLTDTRDSNQKREWNDGQVIELQRKLSALGLQSAAEQLAATQGGYTVSQSAESGEEYTVRQDYHTVQRNRSKALNDLQSKWNGLLETRNEIEQRLAQIDRTLHPSGGLFSFMGF